jgi:hypothetical protein
MPTASADLSPGAPSMVRAVREPEGSIRNSAPSSRMVTSPPSSPRAVISASTVVSSTSSASAW